MPRQSAQLEAAPKKLYYKINEVAKLTNLKPHVLRYWETEFKALSPQKDGNDQRTYRMKDIELICEIKHLLYDEGFTIKGARQQLRQPKRPMPQVIDIGQAEKKKDAVANKTLQRMAKNLGMLRRELGDLAAYLGA